MPRSFLIKKHSKATGVVNADETVMVKADFSAFPRETDSTTAVSVVQPVAPNSVIVSASRPVIYCPARMPYLTSPVETPYHDPRMVKRMTERPVLDHFYDERGGPYDLSVKRRSPSPRRELSRDTGNRASVLAGPSPPPTPPSAEKPLTPPPPPPPPSMGMISSKLNGGNNFSKGGGGEMEVTPPSSWHRPHPFPPYLPFNFPLYSLPGRNVAHPVSISPTSESGSTLYQPPKYFPSSHLMPLSPSRSFGAVNANPTIVRPEAHHPPHISPHHHDLSPRVPSPKDYKEYIKDYKDYSPSPSGGYYLPGHSPTLQHYPATTTRQLPIIHHPSTFPEIVPPVFCSTTPPWSSSEDSGHVGQKPQASPCSSSDSDSGRENAMVTSSLPDGKRRKVSGNAFSPVSANGDSPRYQCSDCNKNYSTYSGLSKHRQFHCAQTQTKKSFSCKYCEKVYVSLGALKMHIRTHTLPCKCKLCGKAFSRPWLLQGHIRTHTGEKPFSCSHCSRAFADRSNLRAHLQTHSDVKKYSCKACSKTFSRMSLLLKHEDGGCGAASQR